jgi:predicted TIM-barrel fold metal-dependent hydrolase
MIARKKAILILHLGFDDHGDILTLSNTFPELKIILAHAAFPCYGDTWRKIRHLRNVRVDLSATSYVDRKIMAQAADVLGIDRCLFGTDGPFGSHGPLGFDQGIIKRNIEAVFTDHVVLQKILGGNFLEWISS